MEAAKCTQNPAEKMSKLQQALKKYKEVATQLDLSVVCSSFSSVNFYVGIVDLTLARVSRIDEQKLALIFYRNGEPNEDISGRHAFISRWEVKKEYCCVIMIVVTMSIHSFNGYHKSQLLNKTNLSSY